MSRAKRIALCCLLCGPLVQSLAQEPPAVYSAAANDRFAPFGAIKLPPTDEYSDTYANPDGSYTSVLTTQPMRVRTYDGWRELSGALGPSDVMGFGTRTEGELTARLGGTNARAWNRVERDGRSVDFNFAQAGAAPGVLQKDGRTLLFSGALPGADVSLTTTNGGGIKENVTLYSRAAVPVNGEFLYGLRLHGLDAQELVVNNQSQIYLTESHTGNSRPVIIVAPPFAVDALGARTENCWYFLSDDRTSLTLVVDPNWLQEPDRAFPITIDPTMTNPAGASGSFQNGQFQQYGYWSTGPEHNYGYGYVIGDIPSISVTHGTTFARFNLNFLPRAATISQANINLNVNNVGGTSPTLVDADLTLYPFDSSTGVNYWQSFAGTLAGTKRVDPGDSSTWSIDVTTYANLHYIGAYANLGFALTRDSSDTTDGLSMTTTPATMTVTYTLPSDQSATFNTAQTGAPRAWEKGMALNPVQTVNLANGNVVTGLPITGWQGFGPPVSLALYHNSREDPSVTNGFSPEWSCSYSDRLTLSGSTNGDGSRASVTHVSGDGTRDAFAWASCTGTPTCTDNYTAPTAVYDTLTYLSSTYTLTTAGQMTLTYNSSGVLQSITDPNNQSVTLTHGGPGGALSSVTDANPTSGNRRSLLLGYDASNRVNLITDPLGRKWTLAYDATTHDLTQVVLPRRTDGTTDSQQSEYVFGYNTDATTLNGRLVTSVGDPDNNPTTNSSPTWLFTTEYDSTGRGAACFGRQNAQGAGLYGRLGRMGLYVNYLSNPTPYATVEDYTQVQTTATFDSATINGQTYHRLQIDGLTAGPLTTYNWDNANNLIGVRLAGNPASITGMSPFWTTVNTYNAAGDVLTTQTYALNAAQTAVDQTRYSDYTYAHGHHRVTEMRVQTQTTPSAVYQVTDSFYDGDTSNTGTTGWKNPTRTDVYGSDAPATKRTSSQTWSTDPLVPGRVVQKTDANGNAWGFAFDHYGNLLTETLPGTPTKTVSHTYDTTANLLEKTMTDEGGQIFTTSYHTTDPSYPSTPNPDWRIVSTQLDAAHSGPINASTWDADGQKLSATNNISGGGSPQTVTWQYTDGGRETSEAQPAQTTSYGYDAMGRKGGYSHGAKAYWRSSYNDAYQVLYSYDTQGRMTTEQGPTDPTGSSQTWTFAYDSANRMVSQSGGSIYTYPRMQVTFTYNNLNEETQRQCVRVETLYSSTTLTTFTEARRTDGMVNQIVRTSAATSDSYTKNLTYDAWGELTQEQHLDGTLVEVRRQTYGYDANGNRTAHEVYTGSTDTDTGGETLSYDARSRLTSANHVNGSHTLVYAETLPHDGEGNQTRPLGTATAPSPASLSFYPDGKLQTTNDGLGGNVTSCYCGAGLLIVQGNTSYGYDGDKRVSEWQSSIGVSYTVLEHVSYGAVEAQIASPLGSSSAVLSYLFFDPRGNAALTIDSSCNVTGVCTSDMFGTNCTPAAATYNVWAFVGTFMLLGGGVREEQDGSAIDSGTAQALSIDFNRAKKWELARHWTCYHVHEAVNAIVPTMGKGPIQPGSVQGSYLYYNKVKNPIYYPDNPEDYLTIAGWHVGVTPPPFVCYNKDGGAVSPAASPLGWVDFSPIYLSFGSAFDLQLSGFDHYWPPYFRGFNDPWPNPYPTNSDTPPDDQPPIEG